MSELTAWGDESGSDKKRDPGSYLLGAALIPALQVADARRIAASLKIPGRTKAHWREDIDARHDEVISLIDEMHINSLIIVRQCDLSEKDERRRRICLEQFLYQLEQRGVTQLTLESRGLVADKRDTELLGALRRRGTGRGLRLDHIRGMDEPLLWVADALLGAVVAARTGQPRWLRKVEHHTEVIEI